MRRVVLLLLALALLGVGSVPANADDPPPPPPACPVEAVPPWCVMPVPGEIWTDPIPVPQSDTGNSGTGAVAEGEEVTGYPCTALVQRETASPSNPQYVIQWRTCVEDLPGKWWRQKVRATFFYDHPTGGRTTAYGNVRWSTSWTYPNVGTTRRRMWWHQDGVGWQVLSSTSNRADAIQVHSSVAYSLAGERECSYVRGVFRAHYVRMPNGQLFGPFGFDTLDVWPGCLA